MQQIIQPNLRRIIFNAAKVPLVFLFISAMLGIAQLDFFSHYFPRPEILDYLHKASVIFAAFAVALFIYNFIVLLCKWCEKRYISSHPITRLILINVRKGLKIIFLLVLLNIIIDVITPTRFYLGLINNVIEAIIIASIGWIAIQIIYTYEAYLYQQMHNLTDQARLRAKAYYTKLHIIRNIATVVIVLITIAAILMSFSSVRDIGISLLASAGFLTAIIGLSAQKTLVSLFSGLQIALSQAIKIGDVVVIDDNTGTIEEVTFTYVTLSLGDRHRLILPISYFVDKPFQNWSREGDSLRSNLKFYIDFLQPIQPIREEVARILKNSKFWNGEASRVFVNKLTERSVEILVQISAANSSNLSELKTEMYEKILNFLQKNYPNHLPKVRLEDELE